MAEHHTRLRGGPQWYSTIKAIVTRHHHSSITMTRKLKYLRAVKRARQRRSMSPDQYQTALQTILERVPGKTGYHWRKTMDNHGHPSVRIIINLGHRYNTATAIETAIQTVQQGLEDMMVNMTIIITHCGRDFRRMCQMPRSYCSKWLHDKQWSLHESKMSLHSHLTQSWIHASAELWTNRYWCNLHRRSRTNPAQLLAAKILQYSRTTHMTDNIQQYVWPLNKQWSLRSLLQQILLQWSQTIRVESSAVAGS